MFLLQVMIGLLMGAGLSIGILCVAIVYLWRWARIMRHKAQTTSLIREKILVMHLLEQHDQLDRLEESREWVN